jgi:DNA-binding NtrC family response regulator
MPHADTVPHRITSTPLHGLRAEVITGADAKKSFVATSDAITIGTAQDNSLVLTDETVSRYHVEVLRVGDRIIVQDHGSTNGTRIGAIQVERAAVPPGTVLILGQTSVRIDDGAPVSIEAYDDDALGSLRGRSPEMRSLMARIRRAAESDASVLILGETGTGKELIARAVHEASARAKHPFEAVDCGALLPTLIASELFGHEKGAFTGAERQHIGAFERADGGTLFLDEIGELPAQLQIALLGALERRSFRRVGGAKPIDIDVRVVCATHRDLRGEVNAGTFRQDLYFRVAVVMLKVPPLRERAMDIPILVEHFLREAGFNGEVTEIIPPNVLQSLRSYRWPGNVRELRNFVDSALAMGETQELELSSGSTHARGDDVGSIMETALAQKRYKDAREIVLHEFEGLFLGRLLERTKGNVAKAARECELNRSYLTQMLKRHSHLRAHNDDEE